MIKKRGLNLSKFRLFVVGIFLTISCSQFDDLRSPVDGLKVMINYDIFHSFLSFRFVDAASGSLIGTVDDEKVKVQITGASSAAVVDQMGNHETSYESVFGLLSLALNPKDPWKPSLQNVLSLHIEASSSKYKPVSLDLKIDSTGKYLYRVMMEKTNVDAAGLKTYTFQLNLDKDGKLKENFSYSSSGGEASLKLKAGTRFQKADGTIEKGDPVNLTFKVYTKQSAVPTAGSLLADVVLNDGTKKNAALDHYRVVDVLVRNNASEILTATVDYPLFLRYKIDPTAYQPETKKPIVPGDALRTYTYQSKSSDWQSDEALILKADSLGNYVVSETKITGMHSAAMHIDLCTLDGDLSFNLQGLFPLFPVPSLVYLYRKYDNRYISYLMVNIPESGFKQHLTYLAPVNTPIRLYVVNYTSSNSFVAAPQNFYFEPGCGNFGLYQTTATSTSVEVSGKVKIRLTENFPEKEFYVNAQIYQSSSNGLLWSKQFKITGLTNELDIKASVPADTKVYLKLTAVKTENSLESIPENISFNTTTGQNLVWDFSIAPLFSVVNFNFHFTRNAGLPPTDYLVRADFINTATQQKEESLTFQVKQAQTDYPAQLFLSKKKSYKVNLKRVDGTPEFMAYPYEFNLGASLQNAYTFASELSPVVRKKVTITIKVVCPQSEIIPTLHGYYRTVWEEDWKEADIVNGVLTIECEMNSTYLIGLIMNGKMETGTYMIAENATNFEFKLSDEDCGKMGW